jgi:hypothetical protein
MRQRSTLYGELWSWEKTPLLRCRGALFRAASAG